MMMKLIVSLLFASAAAFTTPTNPSARASLTRINMAPDAELLHHLANVATDAVRVCFLECDSQECVTVDGWKDPSGGWHFGEGLNKVGTSRKILSLELMDTE